MKKIILSLIVLAPSTLLANPLYPIITVKERLRLELWREGLPEAKRPIKLHSLRRRLPAELDLALEKF
ncbi:MAG: hypothetical protein AB7I27_18795 [Bacteriovoracaceae bacterium]